MRYEFHPEALEEYRQAAHWYEHRAPGLAIRFVSEVEDAIRRVVNAPTSWQVIDEDVRRCFTHIFPYAILYTIESEFVLIVAVAHCAREPEYWKQRLNESRVT
jgi:toxin ParE1/3/4